MSEAVGVAPARRRSAEVEGLGFAIAFGGVALAVLAVWLPYWDPASLRRATAGEPFERNNLLSWGLGWLFLFIALACAVSLVISYARRRRTSGPIIAGSIAMGLAILTSGTAPALMPQTFGTTWGAAAAGIGIYAELVAGLFMLVGGLQISRSFSTRVLIAFIVVGVVVATSLWWYGSMFGGESAPQQIIVNAPGGT